VFETNNFYPDFIFVFPSKWLGPLRICLIFGWKICFISVLTMNRLLIGLLTMVYLSKFAIAMVEIAWVVEMRCFWKRKQGRKVWFGVAQLEMFVGKNATTNHVESVWQKAKQKNKSMYGTHRHMLNNYLAEFLWRQRFSSNPFQKFVDHIRFVYPEAAIWVEGVLSLCRWICSSIESVENKISNWNELFIKG